MLILNTYIRIISKIYITMRYQGRRYYIYTIDGEWVSIPMSNGQWIKQLHTLNQIYKNKVSNVNT